MDSLHLIHQYGSKQLRHICINAPIYYHTCDDSPAVCSDSFIDTSHFDYSIDVHKYEVKKSTLVLHLVNHSVNMKQKIKAISLSAKWDSRLDNWNSLNTLHRHASSI